MKRRDLLKSLASLPFVGGLLSWLSPSTVGATESPAGSQIINNRLPAEGPERHLEEKLRYTISYFIKSRSLGVSETRFLKDLIGRLDISDDIRRDILLEIAEHTPDQKEVEFDINLVIDRSVLMRNPPKWLEPDIMNAIGTMDVYGKHQPSERLYKYFLFLYKWDIEENFYLFGIREPTVK